MNKWCLNISIVSFLLVLWFNFLPSEVLGDLTGDGIDDDVIAGTNSVVVVDGSSGKRTIVYKAQNSEMLSDYSTIVLGKKTGLAFLISGGLEGEEPPYAYMALYIYKAGQFTKVDLPGQSIASTGVTLPKYGDVFVSSVGGDVDWGDRIFSYWNGTKFISLAEKFRKSEEVTINAGDQKGVSFVVLENELLLVQVTFVKGGGSITTSGYNIPVKIYDSNGTSYYDDVLTESQIEEQYIGGPKTEGEPLTVYLVLDNSEAMMSYREVEYTGVVYKGK